MAEEGKSIFDQAREELGGNSEEGLGGIVGQVMQMLSGEGEGKLGEIVEKAKDMLGDAVGNPEELKSKATELGKKLAPDSLDDKVEDVVDKAVDFLCDKLGKK